MKKIISSLLAVLITVTAMLSISATAFAEEADGSSGESEIASVALTGMKPITAEQIRPGEYQVTVASGIPAFKISSARLIVHADSMVGTINLSGSGYSMLYLGTAAEAADQNDPAACINGVKDGSGKYSFTMPVEALDSPITIAIFNRMDEQWYDNQILFEAESMDRNAVLVELPDYDALRVAEAEAEKEAIKKAQDAVNAEKRNITPKDLPDGTYHVETITEGEDTNAAVASPAQITISGDQITALIAWNSSKYDYMLVNGEKYLAVNTKGDSVFQIPVAALDKPISVIANSTNKKGVSEEKSYQITFLSGTAEEGETELSQEKIASILLSLLGGAMVLVLIVLIIIFIRDQKKKYKK